MKLESSILKRSGFLHVAPILDVVLLLLIFFLLGSSFTLRSGVAVEVPESEAVLRPMPKAHVVSVTAGEVPRILFNDREVTLEELGEALEGSREMTSHVVVRGDVLAGFGTVFEVGNVALQRGFAVAFATTSPGE